MQAITHAGTLDIVINAVRVATAWPPTARPKPRPDPSTKRSLVKLAARKMRVLDARPPHTGTGLARRPIEGDSPKVPPGLTPEHVAVTICDAIEQGDTELPARSFYDPCCCMRSPGCCGALR
jgi:hypothetical protein